MPEFPCSGPITVDLRLASGTVELHAEPRDTAEVEIVPYDDDAASREAAEQTRVELTGDTLVIAAPENSGWSFRLRSPRLRVTVRVPSGSAGRLRVATADVTGHGEWSQVKLNTASGDGYLERVTGDLTVNSASGDVRAGQVDGRFTVNTASGDISAQQVGGSIDVKSASGDIQVDETAADVNVKTASGDTHIRAARTGTVRANTVTGDVSVGVVSGTGVWLDLNTLSGKTSSDLNLTGGGTPTADAAPHTLTVQVRTVSGNIDVHRVTLPTAA
jgi:DUF4097 and DUF4098 domain-containing protein YvlB